MNSIVSHTPRSIRLIKKYQPRTPGDLVMPDAHNLGPALKFVEKPWADAFLLAGKPGLGKTSLANMMALTATRGCPHAITRCVGADLDANRARALESELRTRPLFAPMCAVVVDEADAITPGGQVRLLQILDELPSHAVILFTSNENEASFDDRFVSRLKVIRFTNQGLAGPAAAWLARIARQEGMTLSLPEAAKRIRAARNNLRQALNTLDADLMAQPSSEATGQVGV